MITTMRSKLMSLLGIGMFTLGHLANAETFGELQEMDPQQLQIVSSTLFAELAEESKTIIQRPSEEWDRFLNVTGPAETNLMDGFNGNTVDLLCGERFVATQMPLSGYTELRSDTRSNFF